MEKSQLPSLHEIEALTAFLPKLYAEGFSPVINWEGGKQKDGTYQLPYPHYHSLVQEFFHAVASEVWIDNEYNPEQASQMKT